MDTRRDSGVSVRYPGNMDRRGWLIDEQVNSLMGNTNLMSPGERENHLNERVDRMLGITRRDSGISIQAPNTERRLNGNGL